MTNHQSIARVKTLVIIDITPVGAVVVAHHTKNRDHRRYPPLCTDSSVHPPCDPRFKN
jgi:hypothetical protein